MPMMAMMPPVPQGHPTQFIPDMQAPVQQSDLHQSITSGETPMAASVTASAGEARQNQSPETSGDTGATCPSLDQLKRVLQVSESIPQNKRGDGSDDTTVSRVSPSKEVKNKQKKQPKQPVAIAEEKKDVLDLMIHLKKALHVKEAPKDEGGALLAPPAIKNYAEAVKSNGTNGMGKAVQAKKKKAVEESQKGGTASNTEPSPAAVSTLKSLLKGTGGKEKAANGSNPSAPKEEKEPSSSTAKEAKFAGSKFLNSPNPDFIPLPDFGDASRQRGQQQIGRGQGPDSCCSSSGKSKHEKKRAGTGTAESKSTNKSSAYSKGDNSHEKSNALRQLLNLNTQS